MNKQPFYHDVMLLFTATRAVSREELLKALREARKSLEKIAILPDSIEIQSIDNEAGDPADLL